MYGTSIVKIENDSLGQFCIVFNKLRIGGNALEFCLDDHRNRVAVISLPLDDI